MYIYETIHIYERLLFCEPCLAVYLIDSKYESNSTYKFSFSIRAFTQISFLPNFNPYGSIEGFIFITDPLSVPPFPLKVSLCRCGQTLSCLGPYSFYPKTSLVDQAVSSSFSCALTPCSADLTVTVSGGKVLHVFLTCPPLISVPLTSLVLSKHHPAPQITPSVLEL